MSTIIDQRIVGLSFDNAKFEKNVAVTMNTLDALDKKLKFQNAGEGLKDLWFAIGNISLKGVENELSHTESLFSSFVSKIKSSVRSVADEITTGMFRGVGEKLSEGLISVTSKLTGVETFVQGWDQYESTIENTKAIMNSTGMDMDQVEEYLDRLVFFSDETSYDYSTMLENVKKLLSIGLNEDQALKSVEGIATWAAKSGATKQEFIVAVNNMVQAMSAGSLKMIDWKSIMRSSVSMSTIEFKQTTLKVLREMGKVSQEAIDAAGDNAVQINKLFTDAMDNDLITADALVNILGYNYGRFADYLYDYMDENNISSIADYNAAGGNIIEELRRTFDTNGIDYLFSGASFAAAQEYNTFKDVIDATNDAVKSQWAETFRYIFGRYDEAKTLWTSVGQGFYDLFGTSGEHRNEVLESWYEAGGRDSLMEGLGVLANNFLDVVHTFREGWKEIFYPKAVLDEEGNVLKTPAQVMGERLAEMTEKFKKWATSIRFSDQTRENLKRTFKGLFAILDVLKQIGSAVFGSIGKILAHFIPKAAEGLTSVTGTIGDALVKATQWLRESRIIERALEKFTEFVIKVGDGIAYGVKQFAGFIKSLFTGGSAIDDTTTGLEKLKGGAGKAVDALKNVTTTVKRGFQEGGITGGLTALATSVKDLGASAFTTIRDKIVSGVTLLKDTFSSGGVSATSFFDKLKEMFPVIGGKLSDAFAKLSQMAKDAGINFESVTSFLKVLVSGGLVAGVIMLARGIKSIGSGIGTIGEGFTNLGNGIKAAGGIKEGLTNFGKSLVDTATVMTNVQRAITTKSIRNIAIAVLAFAAAIWLIINALVKLTEIEDTEKLKLAGIIVGAIAGILAVVAIALSRIQATTITISKNERFVGSTGKLIGIAIALIAYAAAIKKMVKAIVRIAEIEDPNRVYTAAGIVVGLMIVLGVFMTKMSKFADQSEQITKVTFAITLLSLGLAIIAQAIKAIASIRVVDENGNTKMMETLVLMGASFAIIASMIGILGKLLKSIESFGNENFNGNNILKAFGGLILMALAIGLLLVPIGIFGKMQIATLTKGFAVFTGIMVIMTKVFEIVSNSSRTISGTTEKDSWAIVKLAVAMILIADAMILLMIPWEILGHTNTTVLIKGGVAIGAMVTLMGVVMAQVIKASGTEGADKNAALKAAGTMIVMALAMVLLIAPLEIIAHTSWSGIIKGLVGLAGAMVIMGIAFAIMSGAVKGNEKGQGFGPKAASALLIMAVALVVAASALKVVSSIGLEKMLPAFLALAGIVGVMVATAVILAKTGAIDALDKFAVVLIKIGAAAALFGLAAAGFSQLALVFQMFSSLNLKMLEINVEQVGEVIGKILDVVLTVIKKKSTVIASTFASLIFSVIASLAEYGPQIVDKLLDFINSVLVILTNRIDELMGNIRIFVDALGAAFFKNFGEFSATTIWGIVGAFAAFVALVVLLAKFKTQIRGALTSILVIGLLMGLIVGVFVLMSGIDQSQLRAIAETMALVGGVFGGLAIALQVLSRNQAMFQVSVLGAIKSAIAIVAAMFILILGATGIVALMGALASIQGFDSIMQKGAHAMEMIGNALGSLIGGIIGTMAEVAAAHMPAVGESLSQFMDNMKGFIEGANSMSDTSMDNVGKLINVIGDIVKASIWSNFGNIDKIRAIGVFLDEFGPHVKGFSDSIVGVDESKVNAASALFDGIGKLLNASLIVAKGGTMQQAMGTVDLDSFIAGLAGLGEPLVSLSDAGKDIDIESTQRVTDAIGLIADMAKKLPNSGGLLGGIVGNNDLDDFAAMIPSTVKNVNDLIAGVRRMDITQSDVDHVGLMASMITELATASKSIPNSGLSVLSVILGDNKLSDFGEMFPIVGRGLREFAKETASLMDSRRVSDLINVISIIPALAEAAAKIPNTDGVVQWWSGQIDLEKFGNGIATLAKGVASTGDNLKDVKNLEDIEKFVSIIDTLSQIQNGLDFTGRTDVMYLSTFGSELYSFGRYLVNFYDEVKDVNSVKVQTAANVLVSLSKAVGDFPNDLALYELGPNLGRLGLGLFTLSQNAKQIDVTQMQAVADSINTIIPSLTSASSIDTSTMASINEFMTAYANLTGTTYEDIANRDTGKIAEAAATMSGHFISSISTGLKMLPLTLSDTISEAIHLVADNPALLSDLDKFGKGITNRISSGLKDANLGEDLPVFAENLKGFYAKLKDLQVDDIVSLVTTMNELLTNTQGFGDQAMAVANTMMTTFTGTLHQFLEDPTNMLYTSGLTAAGAFVAGVLSQQEAVQHSIVDPLALISVDGTFFNTMFNFGVDLINNVKGGITKDSSSITRTLRSLIKDGPNREKQNWYSALHSIGAYVALGFAQGIISMSDIVQAAGVTLGNLIKSSLRQCLGISSPSKEAYNQGQYYGMGLVNGLYSYSDLVFDASAHAGIMAISGFNEAVSEAAAVFNTDLDSQPVIRPVVDLTEVEASARQIDTMMSRQQALSISSTWGSAGEIQNGGSSTTNNYTFNQVNNSPKALSRKEIYRQTKNQFSRLEKVGTA